MKLVDLKKYRTLLFDCDGVILNSNQVKTEAFYHAAISYGDQAAQSLVNYHRKNGGISRYLKFDYFLQEIVGVSPSPKALEDLLHKFAEEVKKGVATCASVPNLQLLKELCAQSSWAVVSGGDQAELRIALETRGLATYFNGGIFGSPDKKEEIVERHLRTKLVIPPVLFIGDSKYDYEVASQYGFDFLFVSDWSEWTDWKDYQKINKFSTINNLENWINSI